MTRTLIVAVLAGGISASAASASGGGPSYSDHHCGGAPANWLRQGREFGELTVVNRVTVLSTKLLWNGLSVDREELRTMLGRVRKLPVKPALQLVIDGRAACASVSSIREEIDATLNCGAHQKCVEYSKLELRLLEPPPR